MGMFPGKLEFIVVIASLLKLGKNCRLMLTRSLERN
jgi:hypothetical protein